MYSFVRILVVEVQAQKTLNNRESLAKTSESDTEICGFSFVQFLTNHIWICATIFDCPLADPCYSRQQNKAHRTHLTWQDQTMHSGTFSSTIANLKSANPHPQKGTATAQSIQTVSVNVGEWGKWESETNGRIPGGHRCKFIDYIVFCFR